MNSLRDSEYEYFIIITYFRFYLCLLGILLHLYSFLISLIVDLVMTLSERRNVVAFLKANTIIVNNYIIQPYGCDVFFSFFDNLF